MRDCQCCSYETQREDISHQTGKALEYAAGSVYIQALYETCSSLLVALSMAQQFGFKTTCYILLALTLSVKYKTCWVTQLTVTGNNN